MSLISPKFIQTCENKKSRILTELFVDDDIFSVIMDKKKISFQKACEWIAQEVFNMDVPLASAAEVQMMKLAAKEMVNELKE